MTDPEFLSRLQSWIARTRSSSVQILATGTKSGAHHLAPATNAEAWMTKQGRTDRMLAGAAMRFPRYGVFVHYGVGRGWTRQGGTVVRGWKTPVREITPTPQGRKPVDWLDKAIRSNFAEVAEIALDWAATATLSEIKKSVSKLTIEKTTKGMNL